MSYCRALFRLCTANYNRAILLSRTAGIMLYLFSNTQLYRLTRSGWSIIYARYVSDTFTILTREVQLTPGCINALVSFSSVILRAFDLDYKFARWDAGPLRQSIRTSLYIVVRCINTSSNMRECANMFFCFADTFIFYITLSQVLMIFFFNIYLIILNIFLILFLLSSRCFYRD